MKAARSGMITDIGSYVLIIRSKNMRGVNCMMIEANHDVRMLETGRYPYPLKKRIQAIAWHCQMKVMIFDIRYLMIRLSH